MEYNADPLRPSDITTEVDYNDLDDHIKLVVTQLPVVKFTGRFDYGGLDKQQQLYIMTTLKEDFIVDTQGKNYARYVCRINNLPAINHENVEKAFHHNEDIKMLRRSEVFEVSYEGEEYNIEIIEEDEGTFTSVEYDGNYLMDSKLESEILGYFNKHR